MSGKNLEQQINIKFRVKIVKSTKQNVRPIKLGLC
jgi:hypothetical protein